MHRNRSLPKTDDRTIKPLPDLDSVAAVRKILSNKPRDLLLFDLSVQTGMTMKNLLGIKVGQIKDLAAGDQLLLEVPPTRASDVIVMNQIIRESLSSYLKMVQPDPDDYLFPSRKGAGPLNLSSVSHLVKGWLQKAGFSELSGTKSLRKTWEVLFRFQETSGDQADATSSIKPIEAQTVQELVYRELYRNIVSGLMAPGEILKTEKIAKKMQVSQMPVREAVHRLREAGFISTMKNRGFVINELSIHDLDEITKIRLYLEPMAARRAALQRSDESIQRLESIHQELLLSLSEPIGETYLAVNRKFHHTIYLEANMPILYQIINLLWGRVSPYLHLLLQHPIGTELNLFTKNHEQMLEGMRRREPQRVIKYLKADLNGAAKNLKEMFNSKLVNRFFS